MNNSSDPLPSGKSKHITCHYKNKSDRLQIIQIKNIPGYHFERVVFSGQELIFHALPKALLEIRTCEMATAIAVERIPCRQLRCTESSRISSTDIKRQGPDLRAA